MANIDCVLDTTPMANELSTVSRHVDNTTSAVVAMKAAVIKAESDAADHVVNNVNRGFYSMIHSQISQKIAKLQSDVDSWLMKLNQQKRQLDGIRNRMERDYHMITGRYMKLFNGLNRNLKDRITAIDKPVLDFASKEMTRNDNRIASQSAYVPLIQQEVLSTGANILAGEVKHRGVKAIESMSAFLSELRDQDELSRKMLLPMSMQESSRPVMMPVIIVETNFDASGANYTQVYADNWIPSGGVEQIRQASQSMNWQPPTAATPDVAADFQRYLAQSNKSERVKQMAQQLFASAQYSSL